MLFNSYEFAVFFAVLYGLYLLLHRCLTAQNLLLLIGSYCFYGCWDWRFLGLLILSTLVDYTCGRLLDRRLLDVSVFPDDHSVAPYRHTPCVRRALLVTAVTINLGILGFFKYYDFFTASCSQLLDTMGLPLETRLLNVILPVGISFYTFQSLSYTIDVYRGRLRAHSNLLHFAAFVAFFPQLVAGPILRAGQFLPQISHPRRLQLNQIYEGAYLVFWGLFKKMVIADTLAGRVDHVFGAEFPPHGGAVLLAVYAFAVQIYCDFSAYTDIARGCAKMMGFELPINFNLPFFARNPSDFWRRWHITLSSWLRDYLYIPLGGNRRGLRRTCINLMLTMMLGGLWHGAAITFVLWGIYHGLLLIAHKAMAPWIDRFLGQTSARFRQAWGWIAIILFFHFACLGWLIFRAQSIEQIMLMLGAIGTSFAIQGSGVTLLAACSLPLILMQLAQYVKEDLNIMLRMPALARGLVYTAMFYGLILFRASHGKPFVYFQF